MSKYPRTYHVPFSPGATSDDKRLASLHSFLHRPVILTEKMDGSNTCLETENVFARSHESGPPRHASFNELKVLHQSIRHFLLPNHQYFGEWVRAGHSLGYTALPAYWMLFGIRDKNNGVWLDSWNFEEITDNLNYYAPTPISTVPFIQCNIFTNVKELENAILTAAKEESTCGSTEIDQELRYFTDQRNEREGVVIRWAEKFKDADFPNAVAKYVRANHVKTPEHWLNQAIVWNELQL